MSSKERPTGIRRTPQGWQAYVHLRGRMRTKRFPPTTALLVMRRWREEQRVRARMVSLPPIGRALSVDVATYLEQIRSKPTYRHRRDDLARWLRVFGPDRPRQSITAGEIRAQLETWRAQGYAGNTLNHRRSALMHLWSVLDGASAPNPARDVPRFPDDSLEAPPRALSPIAWRLILDAMPPSATRARLELMAWAGWPPAQFARIDPKSDIRWDEAVRLRPRRKGKGSAGVWLPLLPQAWSALREIKRFGAWGSYSTGSARKSFRLAARKARKRLAALYASRQMDRSQARRTRRELLDVTPYQLRHSFGTLVAAVTKDDRAVMTLLQHADIRTTHRYTEATADPRAAAAVALLARQLGETVPAPCHEGESNRED